MSEDKYKEGYRDGFKDAMELYQKQEMAKFRYPDPFPIPTYPSKCLVCGLHWGDGAMGYACPHANCPGKATY